MLLPDVRGLRTRCRVVVIARRTVSPSIPVRCGDTLKREAPTGYMSYPTVINQMQHSPGCCRTRSSLVRPSERRPGVEGFLSPTVTASEATRQNTGSRLRGFIESERSNPA